MDEGADHQGLAVAMDHAEVAGPSNGPEANGGCCRGGSYYLGEWSIELMEQLLTICNAMSQWWVPHSMHVIAVLLADQRSDPDTRGSRRCTLCRQAAGDGPAVTDLMPTARVLVLLTDGRVDSYQVCTASTQEALHCWLLVACLGIAGWGSCS